MSKFASQWVSLSFTILSHSLKIILADTERKKGYVARRVNKGTNTAKVRDLIPSRATDPKKTLYTHSTVRVRVE